MVTFITTALLLVNIATFIAFAIDKSKARRHKWRIPEKTLLTLAALGGSVGAYMGMKILRHKTRHRMFVIAIPLFIVIHIAILLYCITF